VAPEFDSPDACVAATDGEADAVLADAPAPPEALLDCCCAKARGDMAKAIDKKRVETFFMMIPK
jgi:hypothetical protein